MKTLKKNLLICFRFFCFWTIVQNVKCE
jgi:hypothetical protein